MTSASVALGTVVDFIRGITFKPEEKVQPFSKGSVVCMRTANIQAELDQSDLIAVPAALVRRDEQYLRPGDVLLSSANSWDLVGKAVRVGQLGYAATAGGFISIVRPRTDRVDPDFLFRWISHRETQHRIRSCGRQTTNISNLSSEQFLSLSISLPLLNEQKRLAGILDKADAIRRETLHAAEIPDRLVASLLSFGSTASDARAGNDGISIGDLCEVVTKGTTPNTLGRSYASKGIPFLRAENLQGGEIDLGGEILRIDEETDRLFRRSRIRPGDVLLSIAGTIGRVAFVAPGAPAMNCNQAVAILRPRDNLHPLLLAAWLKSPDAQRQIARSKVTATISNLSLAQIRKLGFPRSLLACQSEFVERFRCVLVLDRKLRLRANSCEELFGSLSNRAFYGDL